jgi:hypothetical protein
MYGAGCKGATPEVDRLVVRAAKMLAKAYGLDVEIRFNTDRRSGGAWLRDIEDADAIGLCANLQKQRPDGLSDQQWWDYPRPDYYKLPDVLCVYTYIDARHCANSAILNSGNPDFRYAYHEHKTLAAGLRWLKGYAVVPGHEGKGTE